MTRHHEDRFETIIGHTFPISLPELPKLNRILKTVEKHIVRYYDKKMYRKICVRNSDP